MAGVCEFGCETSGSIKMRRISWLAEDLLASQQGLCSMELVAIEHLSFNKFQDILCECVSGDHVAVMTKGQQHVTT